MQMHRQREEFLVAALTACAVAACGMAAALLNSVLRRSVPYPQAAQLVAVPMRHRRLGISNVPVSPADLADWRRLSHAFTALGGLMPPVASLPADLVRGQPVYSAEVTQGLLPALGVRPILGPGLTPSDFGARAIEPAVISDGLWQSAFGGRQSAIGKTFSNFVTAGGVPQTLLLAGVMPPAFTYPYPAASALDLLRPSLWIARNTRYDPFIRITNNYLVVGRLRAGVSLAQARKQLDAITRRLDARYPASDGGWMPVVNRFRQATYEKYDRTLELGFAVALALLLIAVVNLSALAVARAQRGAWALNLRLALGATKRRLLIGVFARGAAVGPSAG